jgi:hypothetical protein
MSAVLLKTLWMYGLAAVVSMAIAAVIKAIVVLLNLAERYKQPAAAQAAAAVRAAALPVLAQPALRPSEIAAEHIAAISAAVYAAIGAHRIVHIEDARGGGWSTEGRLAHHRSHAVPTHAQKH